MSNIICLSPSFYERGDSPFYLKPLQTGCRDPYDADSDARFVYQHVESLKGKDEMGTGTFYLSVCDLKAVNPNIISVVDTLVPKKLLDTLRQRKKIPTPQYTRGRFQT